MEGPPGPPAAQTPKMTDVRSFQKLKMTSKVQPRTEKVTKWPWNRSPGASLVDLCSICQAAAVRSGPGPNFGRQPPQNLPKLKSIF